MFSNDPQLRAWWRLSRRAIDEQLHLHGRNGRVRGRLLRGLCLVPSEQGAKRMKSRAWPAFVALSAIWGSSFLWIKIAVQEIGPFLLVAVRLLFGAIGLLVALRLTGQPLRLRLQRLPLYLVLAFFNTALPFTLISWGETRIDSGVAAILNGTVPLFTLVFAHFSLQDERITLPRLLGLLIGFGGVGLLVGEGFQPGRLLEGNALGQLAVLAASASYATGLTLNRRRFRGQPPLLQAALVVVLSDLMLWFAALAVESPLQLPQLGLTWVALLWLGLLGTALAYALYFYLINEWGSTRTSVVTYTMPVIGVILGVVFLKEAVSIGLLLGVGLVLTGIGFVNWKPGVALRPARIDPAEAVGSTYPAPPGMEERPSRSSP